MFHLVPQSLWGELRGSSFQPPSLAAEGFIHLSFAHQLAGTLEVHFAGQEEVLLLELVGSGLGPELRIEASRGGQDFPHLYRPLLREDLLQAWRLRSGPAGLAPPDLNQAGPLTRSDVWAD